MISLVNVTYEISVEINLKSYLDGSNGYRVLAPVMDKVMNETFAETDSKYNYHFVPTKNGRNLALR